MKAEDRKRTVLLGFEMGTGDPVTIPVRHTCITGQTQEAGKTTALEALIERSGLKALVFVTKPGEASFDQAPRIRPYFKEDAQWRAVAAILEASEGQRLKFERPWIVRASQGARTLAEVAARVDELLPSSRGMNADVYLMLREYLAVVVPVIAAHTWAPAVELRQGINVMDLGELPLEMQHLVIRSSIEWVLKHGEGVIIVVPEAWKFLPQGRGTPVKLAAEAFIRQAAARGNFLWLDSQDIGGIEKTILRSIAVWILGVQREANEVKRTLENIPTIPKPKASDIQLLELGQFFACVGARTVKTYVQPAWLKADAAAAIARRGQSGADALDSPPAWRQLKHRQPAKGRAVPPALQPPAARRLEIVDEIHEHRAPLPALMAPSNRRAKPEVATRKGQEEQEMNPAQERKLDQAIEGIGELVKLLRQAPGVPRPGHSRGPSPQATQTTTSNGSSSAAVAGTQAPPASADVDALYREFKARLLADAQTDPAILELLHRQTVIEVSVARTRIQASSDELSGRLALLIVEGFFDVRRGPTETATEMGTRGWNHDYRNVDKAAKRMAEQGFFRLVDKGYVAAAGAKQNIETVDA